ncbi:deoxyribonuclease V [Rubrolithibacter danxiaensis]|uniref:deoxyribonuclease V n=1 Tax=Rubrolithibacter danxiaensis TaxID=3390805 RepID=UPI003BF914C7
MRNINYTDLSPAEAIAQQVELQSKIQIIPINKNITSIASCDISFNRFSDVVYAGIIILSYPSLKEIGRITVKSKAEFPYIPGLLAFREIPALIEAWHKLNIKPDILICDGQGIAHPRRLGIATHFGLIADIPTIGCAKSLLTGKYTEPENSTFSYSFLYDKKEVIGVALRTKKNCKPVYISPGNGINLEQSIEIIKNCTGKYRIPEPTRLAHLLVNQARIEDKGDLTLF